MALQETDHERVNQQVTFYSSAKKPLSALPALGSELSQHEKPEIIPKEKKKRSSEAYMGGTKNRNPMNSLGQSICKIQLGHSDALIGMP